MARDQHGLYFGVVSLMRPLSAHVGYSSGFELFRLRFDRFGVH
jgi:hypothetical protein